MKKLFPLTVLLFVVGFAAGQVLSDDKYGLPLRTQQLCYQVTKQQPTPVSMRVCQKSVLAKIDV
jgi:hypothetical protein